MDLMNKLMSNTIKQPTGCWEWQKSKNKNGYGQIRLGKTMVRTHRLSYQLFKGPIPVKMHVCHSCDNPSCINPDHLWVGTQKDNMKDMVNKGRSKGVNLGSKNPKSKLTEQQILEIRELIGTIPVKEIAKKYNIGDIVIYNIKNRRLWNHI